MWARGDMKIQIPQKLGLSQKLGLTPKPPKLTESKDCRFEACLVNLT